MKLQQKPTLILYVLLVSIIVLALDQYSKWFIFNMFQGTHSPKIVTSFLNLTINRNYGIAFGIFNTPSTIFLLPLAIAGLTLIILWAWLLNSDIKYYETPLAFITGGAIGNMIDRFNYGGVVDFIDFHILGWHYPAFNVADSFICVGIFILIFLPTTQLKAN